MDYLLPHWNLRISFWLTVATGVLLLWQYHRRRKARGGHVLRWAFGVRAEYFRGLHEYSNR